MTVSPEKPILRITFPYSPAEHAEAMSQSAGGRRWRRFLRVGAVVIASGGFLEPLFAALTGEPIAPAVRNSFSLVVLGAFWFWGAPAILKAVHKRQFNTEGAQEGRDLETVSFGPEGITPGRKWSRPLPWSQVSQVLETKTLILIEASSDGPTYLPKNALSIADRANLEALLREHFRDRPKDLRLTSDGSQQSA